MTKTTYIQSPLNYIGGKARLLSQLLPLFPSNVSTFVDLFCGGCNVGVNANAKHVIFNDISEHIIGLLKTFREMNNEDIINGINMLIDKFSFSRTREHSFAYYGGDSNLGVSVYNRDKFLKLREQFNNYKEKDSLYYIQLYTLILFSFNNQMRFNTQGEFNLPVGKRDFNNVIETKLIRFLDKIRKHDCEFINGDFRDFDFSKLQKDSLVYCDPPYLITTATYNENNGWTEQDEADLLFLLQKLSESDTKFALSNVLTHEGKENKILKEWIASNNYEVHHLSMDYHNSNYQKKSKKQESTEVLITNYRCDTNPITYDCETLI